MTQGQDRPSPIDNSPYRLVGNIRFWLPSMKGFVKCAVPGLSSVRRRWSVSTSFVRWGAPRVASEIRCK